MSSYQWPALLSDHFGMSESYDSVSQCYVHLSKQECVAKGHVLGCVAMTQPEKPALVLHISKRMSSVQLDCLYLCDLLILYGQLSAVTTI